MEGHKKITVITGASKGIGNEIAKIAIKRGDHVVAIARTRDKLIELDDYARSENNKITIVELDLVEFDKIDFLGYNLYQKFGKIDHLICNAAMVGDISPVAHIDIKTWQRVIDLNLTANYRLIRSFESLLRKSTMPKITFLYDKILNENPPFLSAYCASKAAMKALAESYKKEQNNIEISIFECGPSDTALRERIFPGEGKSHLKPSSEIANIIMQEYA